MLSSYALAMHINFTMITNHSSVYCSGGSIVLVSSAGGYRPNPVSPYSYQRNIMDDLQMTNKIIFITLNSILTFCCFIGDFCTRHHFLNQLSQIGLLVHFFILIFICNKCVILHLFIFHQCDRKSLLIE